MVIIIVIAVIIDYCIAFTCTAQALLAFPFIHGDLRSLLIFLEICSNLSEKLTTLRYTIIHY